MDNDKYNGWANRATWLINLWTSDWHDYEEEQHINIEESLNSFIEELDLPPMVQDLVNYTLDNVDWDEIEDNRHE